MSFQKNPISVFLFTDIEGSTQRWDAHAENMRLALATHDAILRRCIEDNGGLVFKTVGDAFCAVFDSPVAALEAALAIQVEVRGQDWSAVGGLRVRTALHAGAAEQRDDDYFGPALNRVARILSITHGGQTLLSSATYELVKEALRGRAEFTNLGRVRLKDLSQPEVVYQLSRSNEPEEFPPLRSLDSHPNNLPQQATSFIGREQDMRALVAHLTLPSVRLVTITGAGGMGKTRLSLQLAAELIHEFQDGVFFAPLEHVDQPEEVARAIASSLRLTESPNQTIEDALSAYLTDKRILLILDNFEQVVEAAPLVTRMLTASSQLKIVVTSRSLLQLYGESEYRLQELDQPQEIDVLLSPERALEYEAVQLFVERAKQAKASFALSQNNVVAIIKICKRLDGLPLAIELAAARVKLFPPETLYMRLEKSLEILKSRSRDRTPRQQTLFFAIDWSYSLLSSGQQLVLAALAVFSGGFTLEAAAEVLEALIDELDIDIFEEVENLLLNSLLRILEEDDREPRFFMLNTIREFAASKLAASVWAEQVQSAHAAYYHQMSRAASLNSSSENRTTWLQRLGVEYENIRVALTWAIEQAEREIALQICCSLPDFWQLSGRFTEARQFISQALALEVADVQGYSDLASTQLDFRASIIAGDMAAWQGDLEDALGHYRTAEQEGEALGDIANENIAHQKIANIAYRTGDYEGAFTAYQNTLTFWQEQGNREQMALALHHLGNIEFRRGNLAGAQQYYNESLELRYALDDRKGISALLNNLGTLAQREGRFDDAHMFLSESLAIKRALNDKSSVAVLLNNLGTLARRQGDYDEAVRLFNESLLLKNELGDKGGVAYALSGLGAVAVDQEELDTAYTFYLEAVRASFAIGDRWGYATTLFDIARLAELQDDFVLASVLYGALQMVEADCGITILGSSGTDRTRWMETLREALGRNLETLIEWGRQLTYSQINLILERPASLVTLLPRMD